MHFIPCVQEAFLSPHECGMVTDVIRRYRSGSVGHSPRDNQPNRILVSVRELYDHGLREEAALADGIRRRCVRAAVEALQPQGRVWPDYMIYQGNYQGDRHVRHSDNSRLNPETGVWEPNHTPYRKITIGVYLNEGGVDYEGGELCFPALDIRLKPKAGTFVCYFSDERYEHEVLPVLSGERYSIIMWLTDDPTHAEPVIYPPAGPI